MTYVIAAAGTGGHVNPALAVAEALVERGIERREILFLGGRRYAAEAVPEAGFPFLGFELTHLRRSLSPENLRIPIVLRRTSAAMAREITGFGGRVVLGMSGYVTVPAAMAARRAGTPFVLQEQNAIPGIAARFAARRARRTFLGLPGQAEGLPNSVLVGNPVPDRFESFERRRLRAASRRHYGLDSDARVVGIVGGSQGAQVLNTIAERVVDESGADAVVHLTGPEAGAEMPKSARAGSLPWVTIPFEPAMHQFYAASDVVVCRAGAMTVTELIATRTPSVLVPLARVGQQGNAEVLGGRGAAVVVAEGDVGSVPGLVRDLLGDEPRRAGIGRALGELHSPGSAAVIAEHLIEVAHA